MERIWWFLAYFLAKMLSIQYLWISLAFNSIRWKSDVLQKFYPIHIRSDVIQKLWCFLELEFNKFKLIYFFYWTFSIFLINGLRIKANKSVYFMLSNCYDCESGHETEEIRDGINRYFRRWIEIGAIFCTQTKRKWTIYAFDLITFYQCNKTMSIV